MSMTGARAKKRSLSKKPETATRDVSTSTSDIPSTDDENTDSDPGPVSSENAGPVAMRRLVPMSYYSGPGPLQVSRPAPKQNPVPVFQVPGGPSWHEYRTQMCIIQALSYLHKTVNSIRINTGQCLTMMSSQINVQELGKYSQVKPKVIALYVEGGTEIKKCANCNRNTSTVCAICHSVYYCSSFCLEHDWGTHEVHCDLEMMTRTHGAAQHKLRS